MEVTFATSIQLGRHRESLYILLNSQLNKAIFNWLEVLFDIVCIKKVELGPIFEKKMMKKKTNGAI